VPRLERIRLPRPKPVAGGRVLLATAAAGVVAAGIPGVVRAVWTTNAVELDPGTCGQMLQLGSDHTASSSATPSFYLQGDGGLSSYSMALDGAPLGTYNSDGRAVVCIGSVAPLADGAHLLTGTELRPHGGTAVTPLAFSVDTVPPAPPSQPLLVSWRDSGVVGDGVTNFSSISMGGGAEPGEAVNLLANGISVVGGAKAAADGGWMASTVSLLDGSYAFVAVTVDTAGNKSVFSKGTWLTIDTVPPTAPAAPTRSGGDGLAVEGSVDADTTSIAVFADGAKVGTATPDGTRHWRLSLPSLAPGTQDITVTDSDLAGNVSPSSPALTVSVGASPPPPQDPPPVAFAPPVPVSTAPVQPPVPDPPAARPRPAVPDPPRPAPRPPTP